jgi:iron-sulfur cluster assembly protein
MIKVTEKAVKEVKRIIQEENLKPDGVCLRLRVLGGGCSGYTHKLDLDEVFSEKTDAIKDYDGIKLAVDNRSMLYVDGAEIDFQDNGLERGFAVKNPNAKATCGCNKSFSM